MESMSRVGHVSRHASRRTVGRVLVLRSRFPYTGAAHCPLEMDPPLPLYRRVSTWTRALYGQRRSPRLRSGGSMARRRYGLRCVGVFLALASPAVALGAMRPLHEGGPADYLDTRVNAGRVVAPASLRRALAAVH